MPVSVDEYRVPRWIKIPDRYPMSYNKNDRFNEVCPRHEATRYPGEEGREGGWKQAGYNPNSNSTSIEKINLYSDNIQLRPY